MYKLFTILVLIFLFSVLAYSEENDSIFTINSKSNTIYLGIDNYIYIPDNVIADSTYIVNTDNGIIYKDSLHYNLIPSRLPVAHISIYKLNIKDTILIRNEKFIVRYTPKPCIYIGNKCLNNISGIDKYFLIDNPELKIFVSNDIIGAENWLKIKRFSLGFVYGSVYKSYESENNQMTKEMISTIKNFKPGQKITIKVTLESNSNLTVFLPIYSLTIY